MDFSKDKPLYTTSIVAKMLEITPDRLRGYDKALLINSQREETGKVSRRLYSQYDVEWLTAIRKLINTHNMSVNSVKAIICLLHLNPTLSIPDNELGKIYRVLQENPNMKKVAPQYV